MLGQQYGRWTKLAEGKIQGKSRNYSGYWVVCECGTLNLVQKYHLESGGSKSCGCVQREAISRVSLSHGMSGSREYSIWAGMKGRCHNPNHTDYCSYGEKGVVVCDRWKESFVSFLEDMGKCPSDDSTIERLDVYGDYSPENCVWISKKDQGKNKRKEHRKHGEHPLYLYRKEKRDRKKMNNN